MDRAYNGLITALASRTSRMTTAQQVISFYEEITQIIQAIPITIVEKGKLKEKSFKINFI